MCKTNLIRISVRKVLFVIFLLFPLGACDLIALNQNSQVIHLKNEMIDLDGNIIQEVKLEPGQGTILKKTENNFDTTITVNHSIRKKQSVRLGGYFYEFNDLKNGAIPQKEIKWIAEHLDIFSTQLWQPHTRDRLSGETVKYMRNINKTLRFYGMVFASTLYDIDFDSQKMSNWVLRGEDGKEYRGLRRRGNPAAHPMDLGNEEYAKYFSNKLDDLVTKYGANGVIMDEVTYGGLYIPDVENLLNYDSNEELFKSAIKFLSIIESNVSFEVLNQAFFPKAQQYLNGIWAEEAFEYGSNKTTYLDYSWNYKQMVESTYKYGNEGKTQIWAAWYHRNSEKEIKYAVATYLLVKKGNLALQMQPIFGGGYGAGDSKNRAGYNLQIFQEEYNSNKKLLDVEIGNPSAPPKYIENGYWIRNYQNGLVVVREY